MSLRHSLAIPQLYDACFPCPVLYIAENTHDAVALSWYHDKTLLLQILATILYQLFQGNVEPW